MIATDEYLDEYLKNNVNKRAKRSVDRMNEEKGTLKKGTVDVITNKECKMRLKGHEEVYPVHLCAFTPGFFIHLGSP